MMTYGLKYLVWLCMLLPVPFVQAQEQQVSEHIMNNVALQLQAYPKEKIHIQIDRAVYAPGDTLWFSAYLLHASFHVPSERSQYVYVELVDDKGAVIRQVKAGRDEDSGYQGYVPLPEVMGAGRYMLRAYTRYMLQEKAQHLFTRTILVMSGAWLERVRDGQATAHRHTGIGEYDIRFFPEGGKLLADVENRMAFKALHTDGSSADVALTLSDQTGKDIVQTKSYHDGMGQFSFTPKVGYRYTVTATSAEGKRKSFDLPEAVADGHGLRVEDAGDSLRISIVSSQGAPNSRVLLLVHIRGAVLYAGWHETGTGTAVQLLKAMSPPGVVQCLLLDEQWLPLSERLCFIPPKPLSGVRLKIDKPVYKPGELVNVRLALDDGAGWTEKSRLSVAVTEASPPRLNPEYPIASTVLLVSELDNWIDNPGFYMQPGIDSARKALDMLLLTQKWKRYDMATITAGQFARPEVAPEESIRLSGTLKLKKGTVEGERLSVNIRSADLGLDTLIQPYPDGSFQMDGLLFEERAVFDITGIKATKSFQNRRKDAELLIELEHDTLTPMPILFPQFVDITPISPIDTTSSSGVAQRLSRHHFLLDDVMVTAAGKRKGDFIQLAAEDVVTGPYTDIWKLLESIGVRKRIGTSTTENIGEGSGGLVYKQQKLNVFLNRLPVSATDLGYLSLGDIERLSLLSHIDAARLDLLEGTVAIGRERIKYRREDPGAVLDIMLKPAFDGHRLLYSRHPANEFATNTYVTVPIQGHQAPRERRSMPPTLYWNPALKPDANQQVSFSFAASDEPATCTIIVEGISDKGEIVREVKEIVVEAGE